MNIEQLLASSDSVPILPDTAIRLQEVLQSKSSNIEDIAEIVSIDPTLTSKLLKLANSAFYSFPSKIETVERAFTVIGSEAVYNLALANSVVDSVSSLRIDKSIDLERFWRQSVDTGLIARELAKSASIFNSERLFVCGLLANLSELIVASQHPEEAKQASTDDLDEDRLPWKKQQDLLGFTYTEVSKELMKQWNLPETIIEPVEQMHQTGSGKKSKETYVLEIAEIAALSLDGSDRFKLDDLVSQDHLHAIHGNMEQVVAAIEYTNLESLNILAILSPQSMVIF